MDSSDEISDDILTYLMENINASDPESSFLNLDLEAFVGEHPAASDDRKPLNLSVSFSEAENNDTCPRHITEPISPSVKSSFSSRRLEWDSGADVGYGLAADMLGGAAGIGSAFGFGKMTSKLSTIERMALSSSASKLCYDEQDDRSRLLVAKIDYLLNRGKREVLREAVPELNCELKAWPSIDSSNSVETVVAASAASDLCRPLSKIVINQRRKEMKSVQVQTSPVPSEGKLPSHESARVSSKDAISSVLTLRDVATSIEAPDSENSTRYSQLYCSGRVSVPLNSTPPAPKNSSDRKAYSAEAKIYRNLKEHLDSLKNYVNQLEKTWDFLDHHRVAASSSSASAKSSVSKKPSTKEKLLASSPEYAGEPSESTRTPLSERSIEIEPLNLSEVGSAASNRRRCEKPAVAGKVPSKTAARFTRQSSTVASPVSSKVTSQGVAKTLHVSPQVTGSTDRHSNCCSHCSVKKRKTNIYCAHKVSLTNLMAQREPLAFEIYFEDEPTSRIDVQAALLAKRPDFVLHSEERRKVIQEMAYLRQVEKARFECIPRLFTYHELRKHTEDIYRKLPETRDRLRAQRRQEDVQDYRLKASHFKKNLLSRVLQGQLNLPHSQCLLNSCR